MKRLLGILGAVLVSLPASAQNREEKMVWDSPSTVQVKSAATGKPIIWFFPNNQLSKDAASVSALTADGTEKAEKSFNNPVILKRKEPFLWTRGDQTLSTQFKITGAPMVLITDSDGDVLHKAPIASPENLYDAMQLVLKEKWIDVPVTWGEMVPVNPTSKKLLIVGFDDDKGETLKSFGDKSLVKYHKHCEFVKLPYEKGSEAAKKWTVDRNPAIVICDPTERVLEKVTNKVTPVTIKVAMAKAMAKLEKGSAKK